MLNQFSRTQLLIGKKAMDRLSKTRVAIFGIGGVGGYTAEALARSGVGELDLIDDDKCALQTSIARFLQQEKQWANTRLMLQRKGSRTSIPT